MTKTEKRVNLPWVEKYRPSNLDDLVSHEDIIKTISKFIKEDQVPHLLFYGPPGTGKTSTILACAKQLYTPAQFSTMVLELNASDDRGIGIVRGQILTFASTRTIFKSGFKLIILDEADAMTQDAQNALRRTLSASRTRYKSLIEREESNVNVGYDVGFGGRRCRRKTIEDRFFRGSTRRKIIEKYTENIRFCIICNYLSKIIPALQSRCTRFRFGPLSPEQILPRLNYVVDEEKVKITEDGKKALLTLANGDMRKVLNVLQSTWLAYKNVTEDNVYNCVGHPLKTDIENIIKWLLNDDMKSTYLNVKELKTIKGLALSDILTEIHNYVHRIEFPYEILISLLDKMAQIQVRLAAGSSENIQLTSLISAFYFARDINP
ncbi:replication factor c / dna polymerase iii gamma-tau subunit [Holotrichia oblita]|uniref:Replication factor c / dna polymerase iii gamma-tau subunit n=1 Tax=Holotrichia oblita TaxID=644536 RepID=A0ACB9SR09_HOLOL|nr:replication factor c / dna polymerase iii gamma-tau subunit [Holotrichia oblita]